MGLENMVPRALIAGMSDAALTEILFNMADAGQAEWRRLAGKTYFTTRRAYLKGIQPVRLRPGVAVISLVGELPNMLEHDAKKIELHDTLLGPNVPLVPLGQRGKHPTAKGGEYRAIPFRHATPRSGGAVGQPMGRPYQKSDYKKQAKRWGKQVHDLAKTLEPTVGGPGGVLRYGGRLGAGQTAEAFQEIGIQKLRPYHAVDIYSGMIRSEKTYEKATQSFYMTFRTIAKDEKGKKVGSSPWIRPARKGDMLHKQVMKYIESIAEDTVKAYVEALV
jgi:hypothetical protein